MPYKISGYLQDPSAKILILKESDWEVETTQDVTLGNYEIVDLVSGTKSVVAASSEGEIVAFGAVVSIEYSLPVLGDRGVFGGGYISGPAQNTMDYISLTSAGDGTSFGELTATRYGLAACSNGANDRGVFCGGVSSDGDDNVIDYITISSLGNASDFGDWSIETRYISGTSNGINDRGLAAGDFNQSTNSIHYITISSLGNSTYFGDLIGTNRNSLGVISNNTNNKVVFSGGRLSTGAATNVIYYVNITSLGDVTNFGELITDRKSHAGISNATNERGIFGGGTEVSNTNSIEYITISSNGNSTDFGDITAVTYSLTGASNGEGDSGIFAGGNSGSDTNVITHITITSLGDASDFGDLISARSILAGISDV